MLLGDNEVAQAALEELSQRGQVDLVVFGTSMLPFVWPGARVRVRSVQADELRLGDLAALHGPHGLVVHRVRCVTPLTIAGDAHAHDDPWERRRVVGRVEGLVVGRKEMPLDARAVRAFNVGVVRLAPLARRLRPLWVRAGREFLERRVPPFEVRPVTPADRAALARCLREAGSRATEAKLDALTNGSTIVASTSGGILGFAVVESSPTCMRLSSLGTARGARGPVLRAFLAALEQAAARDGIERTEIDDAPRDRERLRKLGFTRDDRTWFRARG